MAKEKEIHWRKVAKAAMPIDTPTQRLEVAILHRSAFSGSQMKCICRSCKEFRSGKLSARELKG